MCENGGDEKSCPSRYVSSACSNDNDKKGPRLITTAIPYSDLGKSAKDVINNGYHFGLIKLDVKNVANSGVSFNTTGLIEDSSKKVSGSLETKYNFKQFTFSEKWNTDNLLTTGLSVTDAGIKGLKLTTEILFSPNSGEKSGKIRSLFQTDRLAMNLDFDLSNQTIVGASLVAKHHGWLAGYQTSFLVEESRITKNNFALCYAAGDFIFHTNVDHGENSQEFGGSIYQKISPQLETGIGFTWSAGGNTSSLTIGAKYNLDEDAVIRARINSLGFVGLGLQQRLCKGVTLTLSALIDGTQLNGGDHKIGMALEFTS